MTKNQIEIVNGKPQVALLLIFNDEGEVLSVSRKDDYTIKGLPGGKAEDIDQTLEDTLIREVMQETGLEISQLKSVYSVLDGFGSFCTVFTARYEGEISPKEENAGEVEWVELSVLTEGPFGKLNKDLFDLLELRY
jgi:8-oxo-dGTP pyrophosphatase MutT (NUDIX family)